MDLLNKTLEYIFPPICGICDEVGEGYICEKCYQNISQYLYEKIENNNFYLFHYIEMIRNKIISYKFNDKSYLSHMFCEIFVKSKIACEFIRNYDIIIPVPMYKRKKGKRGYNQSELIARRLAKYFQMPIATNILVKQINTQMQSSLGKEERIKNVQNVYKVRDMEKIENKNILLVDDIYTTGATVNECKKVLQLAGSKNIGTIIIAKD